MADEASLGAARGNYKQGELLALEAHADQVDEKLGALGLGGLMREEPDSVGLVRFAWTSREDPGDVCDAVRTACQQEWPGWKVRISPNHRLGRVVDPRSGIIATSVDMGGPASPPVATAERLSPRHVDDLAGTGVTVGVIDTGIMRHPWLDGAYLATPGDFDPLAEVDPYRLDKQDGHGTFVAGLILQQAPGATIRAVKVLNAEGAAEIRDVAAAVQRLGEAGVDIINLSLGGYSRRNEHMMAFEPAFESLPATTVVVAAAGNHDPKCERDFAPSRSFWPAAMPEVVAVAALESDGEDPTLARFSNYGPWVDVSVVGAGVLSTFLDFEGPTETFQGWARWSGTSFAAPRVAGAIAALMTDEKGARVRTAVEAKRLLLAQAEGSPFDGKRIARHQDPGTGRFLRLRPAVGMEAPVKAVRA